MYRHPFLDHRHPIGVAHRGGAGEWPENTWPAFAHAIALGYRYLETDVQVTADGRLLAFHDDVLDRVTDGAGTIRNLPWSIVRTVRVRGREPIVLLDDLLGAYPDAFFNIDAKHDATVEPLVAALHRTRAHDRVCVASFSDRRLAALRARLGPRVCMSAGRRGVAALRARSVGIAAPLPRADCVQVPLHARGRTIVDERFVATAHRAGLAVHVWTIDDPQTMHELYDLGVDGIMTDQTTALRDVLHRRGWWP